MFFEHMHRIDIPFTRFYQASTQHCSASDGSNAMYVGKPETVTLPTLKVFWSTGQRNDVCLSRTTMQLNVHVGIGARATLVTCGEVQSIPAL